MEHQPLSNATSQASQLKSVTPKQAWHKPTVTFVPLHTTAGGKGSTTDGISGSTKKT